MGSIPTFPSKRLWERVSKHLFHPPVKWSAGCGNATKLYRMFRPRWVQDVMAGFAVVSGHCVRRDAHQASAALQCADTVFACSSGNALTPKPAREVTQKQPEASATGRDELPTLRKRCRFRVSYENSSDTPPATFFAMLVLDSSGRFLEAQSSECRVQKSCAEIRLTISLSR